jgi:hypothetical protein
MHCIGTWVVQEAHDEQIKKKSKRKNEKDQPKNQEKQ